MTHYICTGGCGENSEHAGTCDRQDCMKYHSPLTACHCENGLHAEAFGNPNKTTTEEKTHQE